ncbi:MAG: FKBP-type peptidyl-prolyl cis-trans isomerase [Bacteroidota bacterium]
MKFFSIVVLLAFVVASCGNKEAKYTVNFANEKDKLSYVLGAMNAKTISDSKTESFEKLDKEEIIKGFNANLAGTPAQECLSTLQQLFGPTYQDFNPSYLKEGSMCMGKLTGYAFFYDIRKLGALDRVNMTMVKKGFADGLYKRDTSVLTLNSMRFIMSEFITGIHVENGNKMLSKAKAIPGAQIFENGVVMETVLPGKGPNPSPTDDVKVHYILTSSLGDTIQSSYLGDGKGNVEPVPLALNGGVIPGWSFAIPKMKVGGKYRIFIPWNLAYGEQQGKESLCFFVELLERGAEGSFTKTLKTNP